MANFNQVTQTSIPIDFLSLKKAGERNSLQRRNWLEKLTWTTCKFPKTDFFICKPDWSPSPDTMLSGPVQLRRLPPLGLGSAGLGSLPHLWNVFLSIFSTQANSSFASLCLGDMGQLSTCVRLRS